MWLRGSVSRVLHPRYTPASRRSVPDLPLGRHGRQVRPAGEGCAIHEPDLSLAGYSVLPDEVGLPVPVEIADASDLPVDRDDPQMCPAVVGCTIQVPDDPVAGDGVLPDKVGLAVGV